MQIQSASTINQEYTFWGLIIAVLSSLFIFITSSYHLAIAFFVFTLFGISFLGSNFVSSVKKQHLLFGGVFFYSVITPILYFSYGLVVSGDIIQLSKVDLLSWIFHAIMLYTILVKYSYDENDAKDIFTGTAIAMISSPILLTAERVGKNIWEFENNFIVMSYVIIGLVLFSTLSLFIKDEHDYELFHKKGVSVINSVISLCILLQILLLIIFSLNIILRY